MSERHSIKFDPTQGSLGEYQILDLGERIAGVPLKADAQRICAALNAQPPAPEGEMVDVRANLERLRTAVAKRKYAHAMYSAWHDQRVQGLTLLTAKDMADEIRLRTDLGQAEHYILNIAERITATLPVPTAPEVPAKRGASKGASMNPEDAAMVGDTVQIEFICSPLITGIVARTPTLGDETWVVHTDHGEICNVGTFETMLVLSRKAPEPADDSPHA